MTLLIGTIPECVQMAEEMGLGAPIKASRVKGRWYFRYP